MIISMMIIFGFLSLVGIQWANMQEKRNVKANAESFYNHVLFLRSQLHAYTTMRYQKGFGINSSMMFPSVLSSLVPDFYPDCSTADNEAGRCKPYNQTPWGKIDDRDYRIVGVGGTPSNPDFYRAELDIKLPPASDEAYKYERAATLSLFSKIPSIVFDEANNLITLRIDRPDKAFAYDGLVKRSGDDSTLLGDWDVGGNYGITNAKEYTIKASNNSQISVSKRLVTIEGLSHGQTIKKPVCSGSLSPKLTLNIGEIDTPVTFEALSRFKPYIQHQNANSWTIGVDVTAKNISSGKTEKVNFGKVTALIQCI